MEYELHLGDCLATLRAMPDNSVDSIVTDPPYGLSFMGKKWDYDVPSVEIWTECLRVLKPGGHLLAFAGTRTQHRMAVRIEDAGFEIRDMIAWVYGSGFPKSMSVSKAIDKAAGAERELTRPGVDRREGYGEDWDKGDSSTRPRYDIPATDKAAQWEGWGTALKPALEPITVARKPFAGIVAANVLKFGTGAINIDACRVSPTGERLGGGDENGKGSKPDGWARPWMSDPDHVAVHGLKVAANVDKASQLGRWPANLIHDGSEPADLLGEAARFFYCAKTGKKDRNEGLDAFPETTSKTFEGGKIASGKTPDSMGGERTSRNNHPTVKPTELMAYLIRLVTPPGGTALDPFMGSGSTGKAAMREGFRFIGCELDESYLAIARARIEHEVARKAEESGLPHNTQIDLFSA